MDFHAWQTMLDECRKLYPGANKLSMNALAAMNRKRIEEYPFAIESIRQARLLRSQAEYAWEKAGRPHYNLHPKMVPALSKTNLESIPVRFIEVPGTFPTINLRFSDSSQSSVPVLGILFSKQADGFRLFVDLGERELVGDYPVTLCESTHLPFSSNDESIPQALERLVNEYVAQANVNPSVDAQVVAISHTLNIDWFLDYWRIAVTVGFLANQNDDMIVRDVLAKDRASHREAIRKSNASRRTKIENRAKRRGKLGWNVGTNELLIDWYPPTPHREPKGIRGPHKSAHIRTGHFHAVRCGEGRSQVKVKWFRPTVVRPDLPFSEK